jgi:N6-L-threonylcarbamoyladenine synthase
MSGTITVLGIESSCDETAAAVYTTIRGVRSNTLFSQTKLHSAFGGVVPEIASRSHIEKINSIVQEALDTAHCTLDDIDAVAVTNRPGLPGSLLVGLCFAKSLAFAKNKKIIGIDHLEGHAFSASIEHNIPFPYVCITASGGHTALYLIKGYGDYVTLGRTKDDAAGEAFDKVAKMIGVPYPGGPALEVMARSVNFVDFFKYPRLKEKNLDFSFSGLKTAVLYDLVKRGAYDLQAKEFLAQDNQELKNQVASSLHCAIADIFTSRLELALKEHPEARAISFVGGVACNKYLRVQLAAFAQKHTLPFFVPSPDYCTDNAAMIAFVGHYKAQLGLFDDLALDIGR